MPRVPRGGCGSSAATGGVEYAWLAYAQEVAVTIAAAGTHNVPWYSFITTSTTVFDTTSGSTTLTVHSAGVYQIEAKVLVDPQNRRIEAGIVGDAISWLDGVDTFWLGAWNWTQNLSPDGTSKLAVRDMATTYVRPSGAGGPPRSIIVRVTNNDAVNETLNDCYLKVAHWPSSNAFPVVF